MSINVKDLQHPGNRPSGIPAGKTDKTAGGAATQGALAQQATTGGAAASDSVSLTQTGLQLAQMEKQLAGQPAVNSQKVDQVRQKLQSGSYSIDPTRIANKLLGLEFPAKTSG